MTALKFKKSINSAFEKAGQKARVVVGNNTVSVKAIIQPMRYKNKLYMDMGNTVLGLNDSECFLYLGPAEPDLSGKEMQTAIFTADRAYNVSRADRIMFNDEVLYIWAVLTPRIKEGQYDNQQ